MMTKSRKFFAIGLLAALLVCSTGRAIPVSALADPVQAVAPVFDTQIYQLQDYIDNGGLSQGQLDIFYILAGVYAVSQSGSQGLRIRDVYANEDGVWNWFKSMGIRTYNTVLNLLPDSAVMPITGQVYSTIPFKNASALYVASLMGCAMEASSFDNLEQFKTEVSSGSYYLPWNFDIQKGMNSIFGIYGGIYEWQFDSQPFTSDKSYRTYNIAATSPYYTILSGMPLPHVRYNYQYNNDYYNGMVSSYFFDTYTNIFLDTTLGIFRFADNSGNFFGNVGNFYDVSLELLYYNPYYGDPAIHQNTNITLQASIPIGQYDTYLQAVKAFYNLEYSPFDPYNIYLEDFIKHVYVGTNWLDKHEIFNLTDLNIDEPDTNSELIYTAVPQEQNYLLDLHNLVRDILADQDLFQVIINHIVDENGVAVHDDQLIKVTTSIYNLLDENNPVLPINLNDIAEYTDNSFLYRVKEEARRGGNTLAYLVAFWHNCDAELIYVLFGAGITVLVGAFIGKWGHS